ncbi:MAG: hypothetical protein MJY88_04715 [Bacteroidales bacterium]|nr:hypothetical protein [Bacteroidales bacterium]
MKKLFKIAAAVLLGAGLSTACRQVPDPEITEYTKDYAHSDALYMGEVDGKSVFNVNLYNTDAVDEMNDDLSYEVLSFTLHTAPINIQYFDVPVGTFEFDASAAEYADAGVAKNTVKQKEYKVSEGKVTVRNHRFSGEVTLDNGHTLTFNTLRNISLEAETPLDDFRFKLNSNAFMDLSIEIIPTDRQMDFFNVVLPSGRFPGKDDETILGEIHDFYRSIISMGMTDQGNTTVTNAETGSLDPLTEYCLYAYGVREKEPCTKLYTFTFTTSDQNDPSGVTFTSAVSDITTRGAYVEVEPSDPTVLYVWDIVKKDVFDKYGKVEGDFLTDWLKNQIDPSFWPTIKDVVKGCGMRGSQDYEYTSLASATDYLVFAVCVDADGNAVSEAYVSDVFTTLEAKVSDVYVYQDNVAYYDGDALYEYDPVKYARYAGKYYVHNTLVIDAGEPVYGYAAFTKDDPNKYTDAELTAALVKNGTKCDLSKTTDVWFLVEKSGNSMTLMNTITVGEDAAGDFGEVDRYTMYLFAGSCKPISEITGD